MEKMGKFTRYNMSLPLTSCEMCRRIKFAQHVNVIDLKQVIDIKNENCTNDT